MIILFDFVPLQLVYIQYVYYFFRWMFCTTPMCHQVQYQNYVHPLWGWQRNLSSQDYYQHHRKKQEPTEHGNGILQSMTKAEKVIQNSHYVSLINTHKWFYSFCIISVCIITIYILYLTHFDYINLHYLNLYTLTFFQPRYLCMKTIKDCWCIQGIGRERIAIVCHFHLLWILTRRFKIWEMIFFYIMRQRWFCLYQLPQMIWLGMCQCILKFGSWIVQRMSGGMQMHVHQFGCIQNGMIQFGLLFFVYIFLRHKLTEKGTLCNGCLFWEWGHSPRKFD